MKRRQGLLEEQLYKTPPRQNNIGQEKLSQFPLKPIPEPDQHYKYPSKLTTEQVELDIYPAAQQNAELGKVKTDESLLPLNHKPDSTFLFNPGSETIVKRSSEQRSSQLVEPTPQASLVSNREAQSSVLPNSALETSLILNSRSDSLMPVSPQQESSSQSINAQPERTVPVPSPLPNISSKSPGKNNICKRRIRKNFTVDSSFLTKPIMSRK